MSHYAFHYYIIFSLFILNRANSIIVNHFYKLDYKFKWRKWEDRFFSSFKYSFFFNYVWVELDKDLINLKIIISN